MKVSPFQVLEFIRNPDMLEKEVFHEDKALDNLQPEEDNPEIITAESGGQSSRVQVWDHVLLTDL